MNILILHRIPYHKIDYHRGIDHDRHDVTYFGTRAILDTLPSSLRRREVVRPGHAGAYDEAVAWLEREPQHFDRVLSLSEYELIEAARLRERLGVQGAQLEQVMLVRDKIQMKQAAARAGLRVPRFLPLAEFLGAGADWSGPTVLKPHSGASSEDVVVFPTAVQAREAVVSQRSGVPRLDAGTAAHDAYEVEEFVTGSVLHFDGLIARGALLALTASRYVGTCLGYAQGQPLGSYHFPVTKAARDWVGRALASVSLQDGSFHLEAIESDGELVFLEVGNRVGGADVVATFELATGIHLPSQELRILLGEDVPAIEVNPTSTSLWHGWFVVPGHHLGGAHGGVDGIEFFRHNAAVLRWNELEIGASLPGTITYQAHEVPLAGIIATASAEETHRWLASLFATVSLRQLADPELHQAVR